jgi:hypothetical protein
MKLYTFCTCVDIGFSFWRTQIEGVGEKSAEEKIWTGQKNGENYVNRKFVIFTLHQKRWAH